MSNLLINPFNKSSCFYNKYERYIEYLKQFKQPIEFYPECLTYIETLVDDLPESLNRIDEPIFPELDISGDLDEETTQTEFVYDTNSTEPFTPCGTEISSYDSQQLQISSYEPVLPLPITYRHSPRTLATPIYTSVSHKTKLSKPMKQKTGRRPNMPLYDDEYHKNRREYAAYKKQLMYKSLTFTDLLNLYGKLPQTKFYSKFENWLVANNIIDYETTKIYDQQYKLYKIINNIQ